MKSLTDTSTLITKELRDLNQEVREKLSATRYSTALETPSLEQWLVEAEMLVQNLENYSLIISQHLKLLRIEWDEHLKKDT